MKGIKEIEKYLPKDWKDAAKEKGALVRAREIKTAEELLEINLLYLTQGESFGVTSALLNLTTETHLTKKAVYTRIQNSWPWMKHMTEEMCRENAFIMEKPAWLDRDVITADASDTSLRGSKASDYRLHCAFDIFKFEYRTIEITDIKTGEKLSHHVIKPGEIVLADRIYGTIAGMEHVLESQGDFVLRYRTKAFKIYDEAGKQLDLPEHFKDLTPLETTSVYGFYYANGKRRPVRIVAMRKNREMIASSERKMIRKMSKQRGSKPSEEALKFNEYIVVATSLDYTDEQILELYRARWQIEQVFYRLKSMYDFGNVPSKKPDTVKAWFYGKLFLAVLAETMMKRECFSPEEENLMDSLGVIKLVEDT